jgi:hypothetical protein
MWHSLNEERDEMSFIEMKLICTVSNIRESGKQSHETLTGLNFCGWVETRDSEFF